MQTYQVALTLKSRNAKTGDIPVSTTSYETCPPACPLQKNGCYADTGPLALFWQKVTARKVGMMWAEFAKQVAALPEGALWRHNQAGDLPGSNGKIDDKALAALVIANAGKRGFTYTHYDVLKSAANRKAVANANEQGFTINLSANNLAHADKLAALNIAPVAVVLPSSIQGNVKVATPEGRKVVVCPATYRDDVSCKTCGLCATNRGAIIGFPVHGVQKKKANAVANG
jgi:hypothetical protein